MRVRDQNAIVEVACVDLLGTCRHGFKRRERSAGQAITGPAGRKQGQWQCEQEKGRELEHALIERVEVIPEAYEKHSSIDRMKVTDHEDGCAVT